MKRILETLAIFTLFASLTILFFKDVIFSNSLLAFRDLGRFFYPPREYAFSLIKHGITPFWNPYIYCGNPLIASHQAAVFYPVSIVYLFGSFWKAFNNFIYIHFVLSGIFMYAFLTDRKLSRYAAFIGAATFTFGGYMLAAVNVLTFFSSGVWLPMVLWAFFRALEERSSHLYAVLTAVFLTFMFLAGEPMVVYMTFFVMAVFSIKRITVLATVSAAFIAISAFQLLPVAELLLSSDRISLGYDIATKWSMAPHDLLNLIFPCVTEVEQVFRDYWTKQNWLLAYYCGLFPIIMLPFALILSKDRRRAALLFILIASVILSLGKFTPIYKVLFDYLPGFDLFRYPVKYFYLTAFSIAWLAAIGYDHYERNAGTDGRLARQLNAILFLALAAALMLLSIDTFFAEGIKAMHANFFQAAEKALGKDGNAVPFIALSLFSIRRALVFFILFALALYFGAKKRMNIKMTSFLMTALVLADLYSAAFDINYACEIGQFKKPSANIEFLMKDKGLFRVISSPANIHSLFRPTKEAYPDLLEAGKERLYPNRMMEYGIYDVGGYEAVSRTRVADTVTFLALGLKSPSDSRLLDALNVKYVVSPKIFDADGYKLVRESKIANLYENLNVLPRTFLSDNAIVMKGREEIFKKFLDKNWDPRKEVILEEELLLAANSKLPAPSSQPQTPSPAGEKAEIIKYGPNEVVIKAAVNSPKFLVLGDSYYPGWEVYVDGKRGKIYIADYILRAVNLSPGYHTVRFVFDPVSFKLGLFINLITILSLLFYIVYRRR